jgi:hypothetical protein
MATEGLPPDDRLPNTAYYVEIAENIVSLRMPHLSGEAREAKIQQLTTIMQDFDAALHSFHMSELDQPPSFIEKKSRSTSEPTEAQISIALHHAEVPEEGLFQGNYIPVSPNLLDSKRDRNWSIDELARLAFDNVPAHFHEARAEVGARLAALGNGAILHAYGPIEGDYYIAVPEVNDEQA